MAKIKEVTNRKNKRNAWIYGVIAGIIVGSKNNNEKEMEDMFKEFNKKFNWNRNTWNRLQALRTEYLKYKEISKR